MSIMYLQLIVSSVLINFIDAGDIQHISKDDTENKAAIGSNGRMKSTGYHLWNQHHWKPRKGIPYNITYIDRADNMIRLPAIKNYNEEMKHKKKPLKKSPKRTIQKIIKKNSKTKIKKMYVAQRSKPTVIPKYDLDNDEVYSSRNSEMTTRPNQQKKMKKYSVKQVKLPRYPKPFKQMQRKTTIKRPKREIDDIFIIKDFDAMQVLDKGKKNENLDQDYSVVNAHLKNYW